MINFVDNMVQALSDHYGSDYEISKLETVKNNSTIYHGITIRENGEQIAPTFYVDGYYQRYLEGEPIETFVNGIIKQYDELDDEITFDLSYLNFDAIEDKVRCKLINYELNKDFLSIIPHEKFLDLAIVYYISMDENMAITIKNELFELWDISYDRLRVNAVMNSCKYEPPIIFDILDVVPYDFGVKSDDVCMYVITTKNKNYGAIAMLYEEPLYELAEKFESDLIIIPSSIHEIIALKFNEEALSHIPNMIREVNSNVLDEIDILSNNTYIYKRSSHQIQLL